MLDHLAGEAFTVSYLVPLLHAANTRPLWIATLNYDRSVEMAAEIAKHVPAHGFRKMGFRGRPA